MILNALKYSEMNVNTVLITIGVAIFIYLCQQAISRYLDYLKDKQKDAKDQTKEITTRLDKLNETMLSMGIEYKHTVEKVDKTANELQDTVKRVDKIEWAIWPEKKEKR